MLHLQELLFELVSFLISEFDSVLKQLFLLSELRLQILNFFLKVIQLLGLCKRVRLFGKRAQLLAVINFLNVVSLLI